MSPNRFPHPSTGYCFPVSHMAGDPAQSLVHVLSPSVLLPLTPDSSVLSSGHTECGSMGRRTLGLLSGLRSSPGTFGFQGPAWQASWVSPCLGTASLGTLSTLPPGWSPPGCVSASDFYPNSGESLSQQTQTGCGKQYLVPCWQRTPGDSKANRRE